MKNQLKSYFKTLCCLCTMYFILASTSASGQSRNIVRLDGIELSTSAIDQAVKQVMDQSGVQGLNLAVLNDNKIAYVRSYGFKNKPQQSLMDTSTIVYGASLSKAIFGYLVMKLVDEQLIDLDKPLYKYLKKPVPDYDYWADLKNDDRWMQITARMCLSHTTGLPNVRIFNPMTNELDSTAVMRIYFKPGSKYAYSGEGYKFLQLVIEEISGNNIDQLAQEKIFRPLDMTRTGYIWHESFGDDNVAIGHLNNGLIDQKKKRNVPVAGGSMVTTIADYAKFVQQLLQKKGLSKRSYANMLAPQIAIHSKMQFPPITTETTSENDAIQLSYGMGWGLIDCGAYGKAYFKEGNGGSWRNYNINFSEKGTAIVILTNSENGEYTFQPIVEKLLGNTCIPWKWEGYLQKDLNTQKMQN